MSEENMGNGFLTTLLNEITHPSFISMTTSQEVNWFFLLSMLLSLPNPVYWSASLVITNLYTQSRRFSRESDILFRSGLQ
jgi:hypothetical protein